MRISRISSFCSCPNVSFSLMQCGLYCLRGFLPRQVSPDQIASLMSMVSLEQKNKTWINKLKQWAKLSSFLKETRGLHYLATVEIISFIQLKFLPSVAIWHYNASALLPKSLLDLMSLETWKLDLKSCLINHHIL